MIEENSNTLSCEGMCYSPERVLTEIFTLESAHYNAISGISLSKVGDAFYLQEIARAISVIALQCRQQVYSYFLAVKTELTSEVYKDLSNSKRLAELEARFPTASNAIKSQCAYEKCEDDKLNEVPFLFCIRKLCHVEKWTYPVIFNMHSITEKTLNEEYGSDGHALLVEVAKTDSVIGLDETSKMLINVVDFAVAARILITECEQCNLPPTSDFELDADFTCGVEQLNSKEQT